MYEIQRHNHKMSEYLLISIGLNQNKSIIQFLENHLLQYNVLKLMVIVAEYFSKINKQQKIGNHHKYSTKNSHKNYLKTMKFNLFQMLKLNFF